MGCMLQEASFYSTLVVKTVGPIVPIALLWARPAIHAITDTAKERTGQSARFAAKYSLLWLELIVASVSTTIIETCHTCHRFDDSYFLNVQLTTPCDRSPKRVAWVAYAYFSVGVYPIGQSRRDLFRLCSFININIATLQRLQVFHCFFFASYIATAMRSSPSCRCYTTTMVRRLRTPKARPV